jgi:hypothetical protein
MEGVVVCEFGKCQIRCPIILWIVNGAPEILLQYLIDSLRLTINLRMECKRKLNGARLLCERGVWSVERGTRILRVGSKN